MKTRLIPLLLALTPFVAKALDLTPVASFRELEGFKIPIVFFSDAEKKIAFQPPAKWTLSGGGAALGLYPAEPADAALQLRVLPIKPLGPGVTLSPGDEWESFRTWELPFDSHDRERKGLAVVVDITRIIQRGEVVQSRDGDAGAKVD